MIHDEAREILPIPSWLDGRLFLALDFADSGLLKVDSVRKPELPV